MGLEFLGGIANAYKGYQQGVDQEMARQQLEKDKEYQQQQRAFQSGQQSRTLAEQAREDDLRAKVSKSAETPDPTDGYGVESGGNVYLQPDEAAAKFAAQQQALEEGGTAPSVVPTFNVNAGANSKAFLRTPTGLAAATAYAASKDDPQARGLRISDALYKGGKYNEAGALEASNKQSQLHDIGLRQAKLKETQDIYNSHVTETFNQFGVFNGIAKMLTETGAFGLHGVNFIAKPSDDGKMMNFVQEGTDKVVKQVPNTYEGEQEAKASMYKASPDTIMKWGDDFAKRSIERDKVAALGGEGSRTAQHDLVKMWYDVANPKEKSAITLPGQDGKAEVHPGLSLINTKIVSSLKAGGMKDPLMAASHADEILFGLRKNAEKAVAQNQEAIKDTGWLGTKPKPISLAEAMDVEISKYQKFLAVQTSAPASGQAAKPATKKADPAPGEPPKKPSPPVDIPHPPRQYLWGPGNVPNPEYAKWYAQHGDAYNQGIRKFNSEYDAKLSANQVMP